MVFYRVHQKQNIHNVIEPIFPSMSELWKDTKPILVAGRAQNPKGELVFLPFYEGSAFLISAPVREVWENWQRGGRYRPCAFGSIEQKKVLPYSCMMPRILDCIHPDSVYYKNGDMDQLVLDLGQIGANKIFGVRIQHQVWPILSEDVLEDMLREKITGFEWEEVWVR